MTALRLSINFCAIVDHLLYQSNLKFYNAQIATCSFLLPEPEFYLLRFIAKKKNEEKITNFASSYFMATAYIYKFK